MFEFRQKIWRGVRRLTRRGMRLAEGALAVFSESGRKGHTEPLPLVNGGHISQPRNAANGDRLQTRSELPVFMHAMWRTGSTYFWQKARVQPSIRAYAEPLNEGLLKTTDQEFRDLDVNKITQKMRHPDTSDHYFAEYPFKKTGGVPYFEKDFSYRHYSLDPSAHEPGLEAYILNLIEVAYQNRQRPFLQFNRALLRAGWLSRRFESVTVLLLRRPFDIWQSFLSFEKNLYFPAHVCMILGQNVEDPFLADIARRNEIPFYVAKGHAKEFEYYHSFAKARLDQLYSAFLELLIVANLHSAAYSDVVIDINEISVNNSARDLTGERLHEIGLDFQLQDCSVPSYEPQNSRETAWMDSEEPTLSALKSNLLMRQRIPSERMAFHSAGLGQYWNTVFQEYSE